MGGSRNTAVVTHSRKCCVTQQGDEDRMQEQNGPTCIRALARDAPRGFVELRGIITELVQEGSALGLTAAELFLQLGDGASSEGVSSRELRKGLASLSVHLSENEIETIMAGACCTGGSDQNSATSGQLLTLDRFSTMVQSPLGRRQTMLPVTSTGGTAACAPDAGAGAGTPALDIEQLSSRVELGRGIPQSDNNNNRDAIEGDDECATPDSLAPRMSLSELLVDVREVGGGGRDNGGDIPDTSSSAAAHVEAFGRVAADVQEVLTTAISKSGTGYTGGGGGGHGVDGNDNGRQGEQTPSASDNPNRRSRSDGNKTGSQSPVSSNLLPVSMGTAAAAVAASKSRVGGEEKITGDDEDEEDKRYREDEETVAQTPTSSRVSAAAAASRSGPVPPTGAITPPFGPTRSPSEPLHPTRASRERLKAALEGLDLKERLRPTTVGGDGGDNGDDDDNRTSATTPRVRRRASHRSAGARLSAESSGGTAAAPAPAPASRRRGSSSASGHRRRSAKATAIPASHAALSSRRLESVHAGGGGTTSNRRRVSATRSHMVAGVDEKGARVRSLSISRGGGGARSERRGRLGEVIDLAAAEEGENTEYDGRADDAPEVIGRLRAKIAELELTEQVIFGCLSDRPHPLNNTAGPRQYFVLCFNRC